jgi:glycosyltransferase involved in cell wall biosynthesis
MINNTPLFSVLIANFNNGQYIEQCIKSVFEQDYHDWEIILVDDNSTDDSHEIYKKYEHDSRIKIYYNDLNKGCGFTKRKCVDLANGEICAFLDPDDTITPNALSVMVDAHIEYPNICAAHSDHYRCDENMNITGQSETPINAHEYLIGMTHFVSFKRSNYLETEGINPKLKRAVDHDLYLKLKETGPTYFTNKVLYYYRHHSNSISLNRNQLKAQYWDIIVKKATYRRRKGKELPNFKKSDLNREEFSYYIKKAVEKAHEKQYVKMYYCLTKATKFFYFDKNLSLLRISMAPFKAKNIN